MGFIIGIITLLPSILQLILQINELFKGLPGTTVKKQLIMDSLSIAGANSKTVDTVSKIVDKSVTTLKAAGWDSDSAVPLSFPSSIIEQAIIHIEPKE